MGKPTLIWRHDDSPVHPSEYIFGELCADKGGDFSWQDGTMPMGRLSLCFARDCDILCPLPTFPSTETEEEVVVLDSIDQFADQLIKECAIHYPYLHVQKVYKWREIISLSPIQQNGNFFPPVPDDYFLAGLWLFPKTLERKLIYVDGYDLDESANQHSFKIWQEWAAGDGVAIHFCDEPDSDWLSYQSLEEVEDEYGDEYNIREARQVTSWE